MANLFERKSRAHGKATKTRRHSTSPLLHHLSSVSSTTSLLPPFSDESTFKLRSIQSPFTQTSALPMLIGIQLKEYTGGMIRQLIVRIIAASKLYFIIYRHLC